MVTMNKVWCLALAATLSACGGGSSSGSFGNSGNNNNGGTQETALDKAIRTGDASLVTADVLRDGALATITSQRTAYQADKATLLQLNANGTARSDGSSLTAVQWDVTHDSAKLSPQFGYNDSLLISNASNSSTSGSASFAVLGNNSSRYLVLGSNPMRTLQGNAASVNEQMQQLLQNSVQWLAGVVIFPLRHCMWLLRRWDRAIISRTAMRPVPGSTAVTVSRWCTTRPAAVTEPRWRVVWMTAPMC